jgi:ubiquinone/menaquinone biosynthesis C-methylase UbiE
MLAQNLSPRLTGHMSSNALYTNLSGYYDLMCADINYLEQSQTVRRLHDIFGNGGRNHLDLACGTGPHIEHFIQFGYHSCGLDLNQAMLDIAERRCPTASFSLQNMSEFKLEQPFDLISCFLYSIHYSDGLTGLEQCLASVHRALVGDGIFCFNAVDKHKIDNSSHAKHSAEYDGSHFEFSSGWHYSGTGNKQSLRLTIEKSSLNETQAWQDEHAMVAVHFAKLQDLLKPYFEVHIFEHDYEKILPWEQKSGNAIFVCVKKPEYQ